MGPRSGSGQRIAAVAAFLAAALAYFPLGGLLHYLSIPEAPSARDAAPAAAAVVLAALHAALVYGPLYRVLGGRVPTGFGAPLAALCGAIVPTAARWFALPHAAPAGFVLGHALLVELALGLGLALLALGTAGAAAPAAAAGLLWGARLLLHPAFFGGVVPILEFLCAAAAVVAVSLVLKSALAPYRDALMEVP